MEIQNQNRKSVSTKVDLTAMVDLGFLLITFFMLASTLAQPKIMQVIMPDGKGDPTPYAQSKDSYHYSRKHMIKYLLIHFRMS